MCVLYPELVEICIVGNITGNTRLVVIQGYNKIGRIDFDETFVAVARTFGINTYCYFI